MRVHEDLFSVVGRPGRLTNYGHAPYQSFIPSNDTVSNKAALNSAPPRRPVTNKAAKVMIYGDELQAVFEFVVRDDLVIGYSPKVNRHIIDADAYAELERSLFVAIDNKDEGGDTISAPTTHGVGASAARDGAWKSFVRGLMSAFTILPPAAKTMTPQQKMDRVSQKLARAIKDAEARD